MLPYEKTADVDQDIENIVTYTANQWGHDQVRKYITGLEKKLRDMATDKTSYRIRNDLGEGIITARYERHYIFALKREGHPLLILAIFHERMDLMRRLKSRL